MKKIITAAVLVLLTITSFSQWQRTGQKTGFRAGLGLPVKPPYVLSTLADSSQIILNPVDSALYYVYKGSFRRIGNYDDILLIKATINANFFVRDSVADRPSDIELLDADQLLVQPTGTGEFAGQGNKIATYHADGDTFSFQAPTIAQSLINGKTGGIDVWTGSVWLFQGRTPLHNGGETWPGYASVGTQTNFGLEIKTNNLRRWFFQKTGQILMNIAPTTHTTGGYSVLVRNNTTHIMERIDSASFSGGGGGGGGGSVAWGALTGSISDQTDLQAALDAKFNNPAGTISQYIRGNGTLATFPTNVSTFTNDAGYLIVNQTITFTPSGDISSTGGSGATSLTPTVTVSGIKGVSVPTLSAGFFKYTGSAWAFDNSTYITTISGITAGGDLTGTYPNPTLSAVNSNIGSFGAASKTLIGTFDAKGRATAIAETNILITESQVTNLTADLAAKQDAYANVLSSAGTLTLTSSGYYTFNGTTSTWTLPAVSGNTNVVYFIVNKGSGNLIINSNAGGNDIFLGTAKATITVPSGNSIQIHNDSANYDVQ